MSDELPRFDLRGDASLVTGAARGLGGAISLALAQAGADVALGLRDVTTGGELVRQIEALGQAALPLQMDMTRLDQVMGAIHEAASHFGRLDILVNKPQSPKALRVHIQADNFPCDGTTGRGSSIPRKMSWT